MAALFWMARVAALFWTAHVAALSWTAHVAALSWTARVAALSWTTRDLADLLHAEQGGHMGPPLQGEPPRRPSPPASS